MTFRRYTRNMAGRLFYRGLEMAEIKPFLTIEEQIRRMKERDLITFGASMKDEMVAVASLG